MIYFNNKTIHFIGIGGIGMSAIAESLHHLGIRVQGSNNVDNPNCIRLREKGIPVCIGHTDFSCLKKADIVIISTAIQPNNPELVEAKRMGLPIGHRAEMLAELMRYKKGIAVSGTHGKTTTTAMISEMMAAGGLDPSYIVGGIMNSQATNAKQGASDWMVVEADESDGSFLKLPKMVAVVTNIDPEHMDYYGTFEQMKKAYHYFIESISFYGFACVCSDHPVVREVIQKIDTRRILTYGFQPADVQALNVHVEPGLMTFDVKVKDTLYEGFRLHMFGRHNILNALAAITIGLELDIPMDIIQTALCAFGGVERRFTKTGCSHGITIYDDYAHHPVEIQAVLRAAKEALCANKKVVALFQPHRYSRALDLVDEFAACFKDADTVIVADIYGAGEKPLPNISKDILVQKIKESGHPRVLALQSVEVLPSVILQQISNGDILIGLGAGDISKWMHELPHQLDEIKENV